MTTLTPPVQGTTANNIPRGNSSAWDNLYNLFLPEEEEERVVAGSIHEGAKRSDFLEVLGLVSPDVLDTDRILAVHVYGHHGPEQEGNNTIDDAIQLVLGGQVIAGPMARNVPGTQAIGWWTKLTPSVWSFNTSCIELFGQMAKDPSFGVQISGKLGVSSSGGADCEMKKVEFVFEKA